MDGRHLFERALQPIRPTPDPDFCPPPVQLGPGLWHLERRLRVAGAILPTRSTIVDVGDGDLVVLSAPPPPWPGFSDLGDVSTVVAPNSFHYLYVESFAQHVGATEIFVAPGLVRRVGGLGRARELCRNCMHRWRRCLEFVILGPQRGVSEVLFFHRPSGTLILTDIAWNLTSHRRTYDRVAWRLFGIPNSFGVSRNARLFLLRNEAHVNSALSSASLWPFERIIVAHGEIVESGARAAFESAFGRYLRWRPA